MKSSVRGLLLTSLITVLVLPFLASLFLVSDSLDTVIRMGFNDRISSILVNYQSSLKDLAKLDPKNKEKYREQFEDVEVEKSVYGQADYIRKGLYRTFMGYWFIGLAAFVLLAALLAHFLHVKISKEYERNFQNLRRERARIEKMQELNKLQLVSRKLVHEIKNPLTPIELAVSGLPRARDLKPAEEFDVHLGKVTQIVQEEISSLKSILAGYTEFGKLPEPSLKLDNLSDFLIRFGETYADAREQVCLQVHVGTPEPVMIPFDRQLLKQVLTNLIQNACDANPGAELKIEIRLDSEAGRYRLSVWNSGKRIDQKDAEQVFEPYYSTNQKPGEVSMGLGLSIVKKIVLDHQGEIQCVPRRDGAQFDILFNQEGA